VLLSVVIFFVCAAITVGTVSFSLASGGLYLFGLAQAVSFIDADDTTTLVTMTTATWLDLCLIYLVLLACLTVTVVAMRVLGAMGSDL